MWKYNVIYIYKGEDIFYRCNVSWSEAEAAKAELMTNGFDESEIYIELVD